MSKDFLSLKKFGARNLFAQLIILSLLLVLYGKAFSFWEGRVDEKTPAVSKNEHLKVPEKVKPSAELLQAWKEFNARYDNKWEVRWDSKTGLLHALRFHRSEPISGTPDEVVRTFIERNQILILIKVSELGKAEISEREGFKIVEYQQVYEGIPVERAKVKCDVTDKGELTDIVLNYYSNINLDSVPAITRETALELVKEDLGLEESPDSEPTVELVIFPDYDGEYYLTWKVRISCQDPLGDWFYFVDAKTGEIIHRYDNIRY